MKYSVKDFNPQDVLSANEYYVHILRVESDTIFYMSDVDVTDVNPVVYQWLFDNIQGSWRSFMLDHDTYVMVFDVETDAMAFKLRWL